MKRKIIVGLLLFATLIICNFNISNADEDTATIKATPSIDEEKNITITLKAKNIKLVEGILDYDDNVIEYLGIEGKNDWEVEENLLQISMVSNEDTNSEEKEIAVINFKIVNAENIIDEDITIGNINFVKDDDTRVENRSLKVHIVLNKDTEEDGDDFSDDEEENINEPENDNLFDGDVETDGEVDYGGDEDAYDDEGENNQNSDLNNNGDEKGEQGNKEIISDKSTDGKESNGKDTTLIGKILPNTGLVIQYIAIALIIILAGVSLVVYKKMKGENHLDK